MHLHPSRCSSSLDSTLGSCYWMAYWAGAMPDLPPSIKKYSLLSMAVNYLKPFCSASNSSSSALKLLCMCSGASLPKHRAWREAAQGLARGGRQEWEDTQLGGECALHEQLGLQCKSTIGLLSIVGPEPQQAQCHLSRQFQRCLTCRCRSWT